MISLLEPFGSTETFGWPMSCHMPYWVEDGRTLLSSSAVFGFLGISSVHNYKCYSFHLEYHGLKNAFAGSSENDGSLISLEAFLHFLFGGLFPFCHCEKGTPSNKIPEVRKFFMDRLTRGQSIESSSPAETTNPVNTSRDHGKQKEQYEIKISKYYSLEAQDSFRQGGTLNERCTDIRRSDSDTGAVISGGNNSTRVITDTDFNGALDERMDDDCHSSESRHAALMHRDSQIRQDSGQLSDNNSFISNTAVQPKTQIENNSLLDCASSRLHEQQVGVGFGSVAQNIEPTEYIPRRVIKHKGFKPCAVRESSLSQEVRNPTGFGGGDDDDGYQSGRFTAVVVKQENVESELEERQHTSSIVLATDTNLESSEGLEIGHSDEDSAVGCGPIEVVLLPQEVATGASYFDPSTSSITTGNVDNHMTSLQQSEGIDGRSAHLSTESPHAFEHSSSVDETPDSISRHLQYSQPVNRENFNRNTAADSDQNHGINLALRTDASQWKMPGFTAPVRHKLRKPGAVSTCTSTNYSQLHQEPSPGSATFPHHNKRMRTSVENVTTAANIPRHTSAPPTTELNKIPSWVSLGTSLNVMSGGQRQESSTGNPSSMNISMSSVTRPPVHYTQGTSLLNSNIEQGPSSSATGMPDTKDQAVQERTDNSTPRKAAADAARCTQCLGRMEPDFDSHTCRTVTCSVCNMTFKRPHTLRRHMSVHTGVRPYKCNVQNCGKTFARKDNYMQHLQVHVRKGNLSV